MSEEAETTAGSTQESEDAATLSKAEEIVSKLTAAALDVGNSRRRESWFALQQSLENAASVRETDANRLSAFFSKHLLPLCVLEENEDRPTVHRLRELLGDWIDELPEAALWSVRRSVVNELLDMLDRLPTIPVLYCISAIGFRSAETVSAMKRASARTDDVGDTALRLLIGMRPGITDTAWISDQLRARLDLRQNVELQTAVAMLEDPNWLDALEDIALHSEPSWFSLSRMLWFGQRAPGDIQLQVRVWERAKRVASSVKDGWGSLLFTGGIVSRCNTRRVIADLVAELPTIHRLGTIHVWRWGDRVREAETLEQVHGWSGSASNAVVDILTTYATQALSEEGRWMTQEMRMKESADGCASLSGLGGNLQHVGWNRPTRRQSIWQTLIHGTTRGFVISDASCRSSRGIDGATRLRSCQSKP